MSGVIFCSADSKSAYLEMNNGTVPFKMTSRKVKSSQISHICLLSLFWGGDGQFFSKTPFVFLSVKETVHKGRQSGVGRVSYHCCQHYSVHWFATN